MNRLRITSRPGGKPLRRGLYRIAEQRQPSATVIGVRIGKAGRIVPVKAAKMRAGWCATPSGVAAATQFSFAPPNAPGAVAARQPQIPEAASRRAKSGVAAAKRTERRIGPTKLALGGIEAAASPGSDLFRWLAIVVVGFLALSVPSVLVAAAWRDLVRRA